MNPIDILGLNKKKSNNPEYRRAVLLRAGEGERVVNADGTVGGSYKKIEFSYSNASETRFTLTTTLMAGLDVPLPTKAIRTTRLDIPFAKGDAVLIDGIIWTVKDISFDEDDRRAMLSENAKTAVVLYLEGGGGNGS